MEKEKDKSLFETIDKSKGTAGVAGLLVYKTTMCA